MSWDQHLLEIIQRNPELQTWYGHLETRLPELERIAEVSGLGQVDRLLEIGCGNGLGSAYFSNRAKNVVASDLPLENPGTHSIGLEKTKKLIQELGVGNVEVVGCSAEELPFPEGSFDVVLSLYSLEHIPNRTKGIRECARVLRSGGKLIAAVPAAAWSLLYPFAFYSELGTRAMKRLLRKLPSSRSKASNGAESSATNPVPVVKDWKSFRKAYPQFPLPKPHGEYSSYWDELWSQRPSKWMELCRKNGFDQVRAYPVSVLPRGLFTLTLGADLGLGLYHHVLPVDRKLCELPSATPCAQFICLVCEKSGAPGS